MMPSSIGKNGLLLFAFALITAGILAGINAATKDKIKASERLATEAALVDIIPRERFDNDLLVDTIIIPETAQAQLGKVAGEVIYVARKEQQVVAVIIPAVAPDGYSGNIKMIAGINKDGTVAGVRILTHKETPGLGDKIDLRKSQWILGFNGKSMNKPNEQGWKVKKDGGEFDQFTGATITPRAIVNRLYQVLTFVQKNSELLFSESKGGMEISKQ